MGDVRKGRREGGRKGRSQGGSPVKIRMGSGRERRIEGERGRSACSGSNVEGDKPGGPPVKEVLLLSRRFSCQGGSPANDLNFGTCFPDF
jgi:hypothetical protein